MTTTAKSPLLELLQDSGEGGTRRRPALMVTWSIGEKFGGMTAMCLKRASIFSESGTPSAVITFAAQPDFRERITEAVNSGRVSPSVSHINLHEYYSHFAPPLAPNDLVPSDTTSIEWNKVGETRRGDDASVFWADFENGPRQLSRREYFRRDGTLYLVDCQLPGKNGNRRVLQLFRRGRTPAAEFSSAAKLYRYWLSSLIDDVEVDVIVDSKYSAGFLWAWSHPGCTKTAVIHSTHVKAGHNLRDGPISEGHRAIVDNRNSWDRIAFLTGSQSSAFESRFGANSNICTISNPVDGPADLPNWGQRDRAKIVVVGRLTKGKSVDKALEVLDALKRSGVHATLDILGDGEVRAELEALADTFGLADIVAFHGHTSGVGSHLRSASILLLCSSFEGQPLAVLEAKAFGCVPVSYDIDFGPRDVITSGVSGYLIAKNDTIGMTIAVNRLLTDDKLHRSMSESAFEEAQAFRSEAIYTEWTRVLDEARIEQELHLELAKSLLTIDHISIASSGSIRCTVQHIGTSSAAIQLVLQGRQCDDKEAVGIEPLNNGPSFFEFEIEPEDRRRFPLESPVDIYVRIRKGTVSRTVRLGMENFPGSVPFLTSYGNLSLR